jgi:hypothetical protein
MRRVFVLTAQGLAHSKNFLLKIVSTPQLRAPKSVVHRGDEMISLGADVLIFYCAVNQQPGMGHVRYIIRVLEGILVVLLCVCNGFD